MAKTPKNGNGEQYSINPMDAQALTTNERLIRQQYNQLVMNLLTSRIDRFRKSIDPRRDLNDECGYKRTEELTPEVYSDLYDRESIATRVVEVMPKESWKGQPTVYEDEDADTVTEFEQAWDDLGKGLRGTSWHQDEKGSPIWEHLKRADILSGIGHYGVILLGLDDGKELSDPVDGVNEKGEPTTNADCGTGAGGFKKSNRCATGGGNRGASIQAIKLKITKTGEASVRSDAVHSVEFKGQPIAKINETRIAEHITQGGGTYKQIVLRWDTTALSTVLGRAVADGEFTKRTFKNVGDAKTAIKSALVDAGITGNQAGSSRKLIYLREFDHANCQINKWEKDNTNPRFGQPTEYKLTLSDPQEASIAQSLELPMATVDVHWTRIVHLADNLGSSEVSGVPRMRPVYNRLYDLCKLYGGSAEMYWRGAFAGLSLETHPQLGGDVSVDTSGLQRMMWDRNNGLQRDIFLTGMHANSLAPQVVDPSLQVDVQITAICIVLGIPKRVFMGSERGELASSQDDQTWNERVDERRVSYITPRVIVPFVDRLIMVGVLPEPTGYSVVWPDLSSLSEGEKADIAVKKTTALAQYVQGQVDTVMEPMDYLTRIVGFSEEEAEAIIENVMEHLVAANPETDEAEIVPGRNPTPPELEEPIAGGGNNEPSPATA